MTLKLYGNRFSTCSQTVLMTLKEKGLDYEFVIIDLMKGEQKAPDYVAKQPFGVLPVLEDGDYRIYESRAIARYLATKYAGQGTELVPSPADVKALGLLDQAISSEQCNYYPYVSSIVIEKIFKPMRGISANEALVKDHEATFEAKLDVYDKILGHQKYIAGDKFSIVDIYHLSFSHHLTNSAGYDYLTSSKRPNVARWWKDISSRKTWLEVIDEAKM